MNRRNLVDLWKIMDQYKGVKHIKFAYFLAKNKKKIQPEIEALEEIIVPSEAFKAYDGERAKLAEFYSDKDEDGNPKILNSNYVVAEKLKEFEDELKVLKEKYTKVVEERNKQVEDYSNMLEEEIEFDGHKIKLDDLPPEVDSIFIEVLIDTNLLKDQDE